MLIFLSGQAEDELSPFHPRHPSLTEGKSATHCEAGSSRVSGSSSALPTGPLNQITLVRIDSATWSAV